MSLLMTEPQKYAAPIRGTRPADTARMVDTATRLHAWSIPLPCCVHGTPFEQHCEQCSAAAPLDVAVAHA
jgi:hypothetical protein